jgi:Flp pilus assembly protein TadB
MKLKKKKKTLNLKHKIALFLVYFVLFGTLSALIDYYAYDLINPLIFIILSFIGAAWATMAHANSKQKSKADELAKEIEEIL